MAKPHQLTFGGINPDAAALETLARSDYGGPLHFVNLLAFHEQAQYPAGHELADAGLTGLEAYLRYAAVAIPHVAKRNGRLVTAGLVLQELIGAGDGWDQVAVMEYPDTAAFLDMIADPDYTAAVVHRDAGLARTALYVTRPLSPEA